MTVIRQFYDISHIYEPIFIQLKAKKELKQAERPVNIE